MKHFIYPFIIAATLVACKPDSSETTAEPAAENTVEANSISLTQNQVKNAGIVSETLGSGTLSDELKVNGIVEVPPQNLVSVSFPLGGYLSSTELLPGMQIRKGQTIAWMEDPAYIQLQQDYLVAASRITYLEKTYKRQQALNASKANSDQSLEQAESEYKAQRIQWHGLREKLRLLGLNPDRLSETTITRKVAIHAPINGFVSKVNVNIGKYVNPTDVLFELVNPDDIHAALTVFEKDIPALKIGQKVALTLSDRPNEVHPAEIILISRNLDENRSVVVHCHFEKEDHSLLPGMFLNARIAVSDTSGIIVPEEAVVRFGNDECIFTDNGNGNYSMVTVKRTATQDGKILVAPSENITGKKIVVKNAYALLSKLKNTEEEE